MDLDPVCKPVDLYPVYTCTAPYINPVCRSVFWIMYAGSVDLDYVCRAVNLDPVCRAVDPDPLCRPMELDPLYRPTELDHVYRAVFINLCRSVDLDYICMAVDLILGSVSISTVLYTGSRS